MRRLIDAEEFKKQIAGMAIVNNYPPEKANALCELIDAQQTVCDPDKVVVQLERALDDIPIQYEYNYEKGVIDGLIKALDIVEENWKTCELQKILTENQELRLENKKLREKVEKLETDKRWTDFPDMMGR